MFTYMSSDKLKESQMCGKPGGSSSATCYFRRLDSRRSFSVWNVHSETHRNHTVNIS